MSQQPFDRVDALPRAFRFGQEKLSQQPVVITDVQIPFGRMVMLILQVMLASIPAIILFYLIMGVCVLLFGGLFASLFAASQTLQ